MKIKRKIYSSKSTSNLSYKRRMFVYWSYASFYFKLSLLSFILYMVFAPASSFLKSEISSKSAEILADLGFILENVEVIGQKNVSNIDIINSLSADVGTPLFSIDLEDSKNRIKNIGWVKGAIVQRKLPDTIVVNLLEKDPIALWQHDKKVYVIDSEGEIIDGASADKLNNLIYLVGDGANVYATELINSLNKNKSLAGKIIYATRYGQRRWDLQLEEDIKIRMPQDNFDKAYQYLIKLYESDKLFSTGIKSIDIRDIEKIYIEKIKSTGKSK